MRHVHILLRRTRASAMANGVSARVGGETLSLFFSSAHSHVIRIRAHAHPPCSLPPPFLLRHSALRLVRVSNYRAFTENERISEALSIDARLPHFSLSLSVSRHTLSTRVFDFRQRKRRVGYILLVYVTYVTRALGGASFPEQRWKIKATRALSRRFTRITRITRIKRRLLLTVAATQDRTPSSRVSSELSEAIRQRSQRPVFAIVAFPRRHPDSVPATRSRYLTVRFLFHAFIRSILVHSRKRGVRSEIAEAAHVVRPDDTRTTRGRRDDRRAYRCTPVHPLPSTLSLSLWKEPVAPVLRGSGSRGPPAFSLTPSRSRRDNAVAMTRDDRNNDDNVDDSIRSVLLVPVARPPLLPVLSVRYCDVQHLDVHLETYTERSNEPMDDDRSLAIDDLDPN